MKGDEVLVRIVITRRYAGLPAKIVPVFLAIRELCRTGIAAAAFWLLVQCLGTGTGIPLGIGILWLLAGPWISNETPGQTYLLLTKEGICYMEQGLYCTWEDVESHTVLGNVLHFKTAPTNRFLGQRLWRIPLAGATGAQIRALFNQRDRRRSSS